MDVVCRLFARSMCRLIPFTVYMISSATKSHSIRAVTIQPTKLLRTKSNLTEKRILKGYKRSLRQVNPVLNNILEILQVYSTKLNYRSTFKVNRIIIIDVTYSF